MKKIMIKFLENFISFSVAIMVEGYGSNYRWL